MTLQKGPKPGCMTLQNFGQALVLVAASVCKCGGCMTLQKSAFRWLHEAANWHAAMVGWRGRMTVRAIVTYAASIARLLGCVGALRRSRDPPVAA